MTQQQSARNMQDGFVPDHVPPHLVKPFDLYMDPEIAKCPFTGTTRFHGQERVFWNPVNRQFGGSWVLTRAEDIRYVLTHPELFSSKEEAGFSKLVGEAWDLIPLELDPPEHTRFRQLLNPLLAPGVINRMTPDVTRRAVDLIEAVRGRGECEFMEAFGRPFPVSIFMQLMGLPDEQIEQFLQWEFDLLHSSDIPTRIGAAIVIRDYLRELARERRANPTDDLTSFVVTAELDGKPLSDDQVMGILYLMFVGGLDTVASSLGFFFHHLAENPDQQQRLRENPDLIPRAVEEMLRRFSVVTAHRRCTQDIDFNGVAMKQGDWITINYALASLDPEEFACPMEVDLDRKDNRHLAFSFGPHFCIGNHLARRELQVALREWLARVPQWRIKPGEYVDVHGGGVFGIERLVLEWPAR